MKDFINRKGGRLRQKFIKEYLLPQLKAGYKAMYDQNIVHRDIKLENIFITDNKKTLKLANFGNLKSISPPQQQTHKLLRINYYNAPPELLKSESYNKSSDIFSLGSVFHEMCTYEKLWKGANVGQARKYA